jgi:hypothetical protein
MGGCRPASQPASWRETRLRQRLEEGERSYNIWLVVCLKDIITDFMFFNVCVCVLKRYFVSKRRMCVCVREREKERESVCVRERERE